MSHRTNRLDGLRVLVTGAGGPAGYGVIERLTVALPGVQIHAADCSPHASGLYLVPPGQRHIVPRGDDPEFAATVFVLCLEHGIDLVIPTVDTELLPLSETRTQLAAEGVEVAVADPEPLAVCADKLALTEALSQVVPVGRTEVWRGVAATPGWPYPFVLKPRRGSGARGFSVVHSKDEALAAPTDGSMMAMEWLPGIEYSVDVFRTRAGKTLAAVPRQRILIDSGVAVVARTRHDPELQALAREAVDHLGLAGVSNVQFRRDEWGCPRLLEINPRFPGTMSLTVAAGVDMPQMAVLDAMGETVTHDGEFRDIAVVRRWRQLFLEVEQLEGHASPSSQWAVLDRVG